MREERIGIFPQVITRFRHFLKKAFVFTTNLGVDAKVLLFSRSERLVVARLLLIFTFYNNKKKTLPFKINIL